MNGWNTIPLGEIMPERAGTVDPSKFPDELFDLYSVPAFDDGVPDIVPGKEIGSAKQIVQPGDVLLSKIVPHIRRTWIVGGNRGRRLIASSEWIVFRDNRFWPPFLRHILVSDPFHVEFMATVSGVGGSLLRARPAHVAKIKIPEPSISQQQQIAAILDQAEALRAKRRQALAKVNALTQSLFLDLFGDPVTNPEKWDSLPLPEACNLYSGGTPSKAVEEYWQGNVPWFSPKDLKADDLFDSIDHINRKVTEETRLRLLPTNTVAIVVRGMILAHSFPVSVLRVPATINQDLKALLPKADLEPQFIAACLRAQKSHALNQVSNAGHGTKRLDADGLNKITMLLPPKNLQQQFIDQVRAVERLKSLQSASNSKMESLFASLQHRAFRGEL